MNDYDFKRKYDFDDLMRSRNVAQDMDKDDLSYIGQKAKEGYQEDLSSRADWEKRMAVAMKLALQVVDGKSFPWQGASDVKFPLVTNAAMQYHARAYPALIDCNDLVKVRIWGEDPTGEKTARGERIGTHMSWQNLKQDKRWEEEHDKGYLVQAICGDAFIKTVFDPTCGHKRTRLVLPKDFVINYWTRDLDTSPRYTHIYQLSNNDVRQREIDGTFVVPPETDSSSPQGQTPQLGKTQGQDQSELKLAQDQRTGITEPQVSSATPYLTGEQYCWFDLDGDGMEEPYIVTFDVGTGVVRRVCARWLPSQVKRIGKEVYEITPTRFFTRIPFIPSPDGGFYSLGLGMLLGPLNESVNTSLNQLFDAGTMSTLGGGFTGRGFKGRGGPFTIRPFEWYPIDAPGDDLRKNVLPLPVREPSGVLFQLLGFLVQYAERLVSATEMQVGENPGQNTPAETARTMNENGSRVYNAIYKRVWRAMGEEYCLQYELNANFLAADSDYVDLTTGGGALVRKDDYSGKSLDIEPSADPTPTSDTQRIAQADAVVAMANQLPGFNRYQSQRRALMARKIPNIDEIMPQPMQAGQPGPNGQPGKPVPAPDFPPPPNPKMMEIQVKQGEMQIKAQAQQLKAQEFQSAQLKMKIDLQMEAAESQAVVNKLQAEAVNLIASAQATAQDPHIKLIYAAIEAEGIRTDRAMKMIDIITKNMGDSSGSESKGDGGRGMAGLEAQPTNADLLAVAAGGGAGGNGAMVGGQTSIQ